MNPDDPRHGTEAGYTAHRRDGQTSCDPCRTAHMVAQKRRQLYPSKVPALGTQRRIQALQALGHGRGAIARHGGWQNEGALAYLMKPTTVTVYATTAARVAAVYADLCMVVPVGQGPARARTWARRHGFATPLAWDDIDTDPEPHGVRKTWGADYDSRDLIDHATVDRILAGEHLPANQAERLEVMRRWLAAGRSEQSLCTRMGWKAARYTPRKEGAA